MSEPSPRIVSLLPSITEILGAIGLGPNVVGVTHECDFPESALAGAQVVTTSDISPHAMTQEQIHEAVVGSLVNGNSLYGLDAEVLQAVRPDIVFTQSLCDICAVSYPVVLDRCSKIVAGPKIGEALSGASANPRVVNLEPKCLADVIGTLRTAGTAVGPEHEARAAEVAAALEAGFDRVRAAVSGRQRPRAVFMEWHEPIFNGGHWSPDMMGIAGA